MKRKHLNRNVPILDQQAVGANQIVASAPIDEIAGYGALGTIIAGPVLNQLNHAFDEGHNEPRLRWQMDDLFQFAWMSLPRDPLLSKRLQALVPEHCERLRWDDAEMVVDAIEHLVKVEKLKLHAEVIALRIIIARLGGVHSAMRIGRLAIAELQTRFKPGYLQHP